MLWQFQGMTKRAFMEATSWDLYNAYGRPNANEGKHDKPYWPVPRFDPDDPPTREMTFRGLWWENTGKAMKTMGFSDEEIEARYTAWIEGYQFGS